MKKLLSISNDEKGVSAIELGLLVALIAISFITAMLSVGDEILAAFKAIAAGLGFATQSAAG